MGLLRRLAVVASSAAMVAGMGVVCASAASASPTAANLCLFDVNNVKVYCTVGVANGDVVAPTGATGGTNWYYPDPGTRTVADASVNLCWQVDTTGDLAGLPRVITTHTCNTTAHAQEFAAIPGPDVGALPGFLLVSQWDGDCVAYNSNDGVPVFYLTTCGTNTNAYPWYELFYAP
jgi:hypothetical protein